MEAQGRKRRSPDGEEVVVPSETKKGKGSTYPGDLGAMLWRTIMVFLTKAKHYGALVCTCRAFALLDRE